MLRTATVAHIGALLAPVALLAACVPAAPSAVGHAPSSRSRPAPAVPLSRPGSAAPPILATSATPRPKRSDEPPAALLNAVQALGAGFRGQVAISVRDVDHGWIVAWNGERPHPQQSVSKLWVAIAVFDAIDYQRLSLATPVTVTAADLTVFHQPIRALLGPNGYRTTVGALLECALTRSDNTCNDVLLWKVGGPAAIRRMLQDKGVIGVGFGPGERELQAKTAGLVWRREWAGGWGFLQARAALPAAERRKALDRYLAAPYDGASANGITLGLSLLAQNKLLSQGATDRLFRIMLASKTGPMRLKSGLRPGWKMAHKTGTGQELGSLATGYNDVGLLTGPNGHRYAIAVLIASTREPIPVRMRLMGDVTRAVIRTAG